MNTATINDDIYAFGFTNFYSVDGTDNNFFEPNYGSVGSDLFNVAPIDYGDGISSPTGSNRPNARVISNTLAQQEGIIQSDRGLTNFSWAFGQFVDHDLILSPENEELEIEIAVPTGDRDLDPNGTGEVTIPLNSTAFREGTGTDIHNPAQIPNNITAWLDGSNIYGSDQERNDYLREGSSGLLKVSEGNLLPFANETFANDNPTRQDPSSLFAAGDVRANENSVLASMHTLFVREHNRLARELAIAHPDWTDDQLYERSRQINIAQYQAIVYNEYLPAILGDNALTEYSGYDSTINPSIDRSFGSAGFRIGHTQLSSEVLRLDTVGNEISEGNLTLADLFFRSSDIVQESGIDPILRGLGSSLSQNIDLKLIDDVRNLLFTFGPHTTGRDLFAINIERGRINGISDYNTVRDYYGLDRVDSFDDITSDVTVQNQLASLYGNVNNIDLFVGLLAEDHLPGIAVGETFQAVISEQFLALRDGDRLYYENIFSQEEIAEIEGTSLTDIVLRNTDTIILQDNAFSLLNEGTDASDELNGGLGNDSIFGGLGDDLLKGFQGDDFLDGGEGNDRIFGGAGNDTINGDAGNDGNYADNYQAQVNLVGHDLVTNGSFENNRVHSGRRGVFKSMPGWYTTFGPGIEVKEQARKFGAAADGHAWVELDSYGNSGMAQKIDTHAGATYQLSVDYTPRQHVSPSKVKVWWDGEKITTLKGQGGHNNNWNTYTFEVEASYADFTKLEFRAAGHSNGVGGFIDNVQLFRVGNDPLAHKFGTEKVIGHDKLFGGDGNDTIFGGAGSDTIFGGAGNDILHGTDGHTGGANQEDRLIGGAGHDTFVLADANGGFYNNQRWHDCVIVEDFNRHQDTVQLSNDAHYWLGSWNGNSYIYEYADHRWDGVAVLENVKLNQHDLSNSQLFEYV